MNLVKVAAANGWQVLEENEQWKNRLEISGSSGNRYIVAQHKKNGQWSCACLGFRRHRHCKHLDAMLPTLLKLETSKQQIEESA